MAVTFGSLIAGTSGELKKGTAVLSVTEAKYFNVEGASIIVGALGPRDITCEHWLHASYTSQAVASTALTNLGKAIGKTRTLSNSIGESFNNCTFVAIDIVEGPVNNNLGWMYVLTLRWRQLSR